MILRATTSGRAKATEAAALSFENYTLRLTFIAFLFALLFYPTAAMATDPLTSSLCTVIQWFNGGLGKAIATLGIVVAAIGALLGKVSWQLAFTVIVGISVMFGGAQLVDLLTAAGDSGVVSATAVCPENTGPSAGEIQNVLCRLAEMANSNAGRAFGTLAIIILGIGALLGKFPPAVALLSAVGIAALFGADNLATTLGNVANPNLSLPSGCAVVELGDNPS